MEKENLKMKNRSYLRFISLAALTLIILLFTLLIMGETSVYAANYYCSPTGSGTTCSSGSPCTLATGLTKLTSGSTDTLYLKDGTYTATIDMPISGTALHYLTIKAENDGNVIIDGQNARQPLLINGKSYINIEGIVFKNSNADVVYIKNANGVNIKRVSAYNAYSGGNFHAFDIWLSSNVLLEDCSASGTARLVYSALSSDNVTFRRCWGRWTATGTPDWRAGLVIYGSNNCRVENCVITTVPNGASVGIQVVKQVQNFSADNNSIYGNIVYGFPFWAYGMYVSALAGSGGTALQGNQFKNNVLIANGYGFGFLSSADVESMTLVNTTYNAIGVSKGDATLPLYATLKNSSLLGGDTGISASNYTTFSHIYNNLSGFTYNYISTTQGTGETFNNPAYNTATYGKGAYLMVPDALKGRGENGADIGAKVLYRYQDGVPTSIPLWPWPMEDRVFRETGVSVTLEANGGIWKTLDGVYSQVDTIPPTAPTGLSVQ